MDLFENSGCRLKVERGNRVFPQSDHSSDVIQALEQLLKANHVQVHLRTSVTEILIENNQVKGVRTSKGEVIATSKVLIATGGLSYPTTGSTGDGYQFAKKCNHTVTPLTPSLVPFNVAEDYVKQWQGISLKNVGFRLLDQNKVIFDDFENFVYPFWCKRSFDFKSQQQSKF